MVTGRGGDHRYGGWAGQVGGFDVAASAYRYPSGDNVNYVAFPLQIGRSYASLGWAVGVALVPAQAALRDEENPHGWTSLNFAPSSRSCRSKDVSGMRTRHSPPAEKPNGPSTSRETWVE